MRRQTSRVTKYKATRPQGASQHGNSTFVVSASAQQTRVFADARLSFVPTHLDLFLCAKTPNPETFS